MLRAMPRGEMQRHSCFAAMCDAAARHAYASDDDATRYFAAPVHSFSAAVCHHSPDVALSRAEAEAR